MGEYANGGFLFKRQNEIATWNYKICKPSFSLDGLTGKSSADVSRPLQNGLLADPGDYKQEPITSDINLLSSDLHKRLHR